MVLTRSESQSYNVEMDTLFTMRRNYNMGSANDNHHQDGYHQRSLREDATQLALSSFLSLKKSLRKALLSFPMNQTARTTFTQACYYGHKIVLNQICVSHFIGSALKLNQNQIASWHFYALSSVTLNFLLG